MLVTTKKISLRQVAANTDEVVATCPVPPGGRLAKVDLRMSYGPSSVVAFDAVLACAVIGFMLPILDPDAATSVATLWDQLVPKDESQADDEIDLDQITTADPTPEWEPGAPDLGALLDINDNVEFFRRRVWMDINSHPQFIHLDTTVKYLPGESWSSSLAPGVRSDVFAMAMVGFSSPVTTISTTAEDTAPTKQEWGWMMFLEDTIKGLMIVLFSATEAGATTPYVEQATFISKLTEPSIHEASQRAGDFTATTWNVNTQCTFQVVMPEHGERANLTSS